MKLMKVSAVILAGVLLLSAAVIEMAAADQDPPTNISGFCKDKCSVRCSKAGRRNRCLLYCGICCTKCNCVPPGTYGNRDACPCYRDLKNSKGQPKCP